jgi:type II secretory pathway component GspD/PulD (secretin)
MEAEENGSPAVMKLGDRVPIVTGGPARAEEEKLLNVQFQYLDVGLNITSWIRERQGRLGLTVSVDQSSVARPNEALRVAPNQPMIRQLKMENTALVTLGKPTLIASVDDPGKANHKYTVDATVTKLNP